MKLQIIVATVCVVGVAASGWWQVYRAPLAKRAKMEEHIAMCLETIDDTIVGKITAETQTTLTNCLWQGGQPMKDELNRRLVAAGKAPVL